MPDYGHDLLFGTVLMPSANQPEEVVLLARLADEAGWIWSPYPTIRTSRGFSTPGPPWR
jgi:hypothetical protein